MGRNIYAEGVVRLVRVDGIVDDFTDAVTYCGLPLIRSEALPADALVLVVSGGRPLSAGRRLDALGIAHLDYFSFLRHSGLPLVEISMNEGFREDYASNRARYEWCRSLLDDDESRRIFDQLIAFKTTYDIACLEGFATREDEQYFEDFLKLSPDGECFVDVGGFDGANTLEFIRHAPGYRSVQLFEPDPANFRVCQSRLEGLRDVHLYGMGVAERRAELRMQPLGSTSRLADDGPIVVPVDRLDRLLEGCDPPTLIKMDIEGAELAALEGARGLILDHHPRLAISAYHVAGDYYRIPEVILGMRRDYRILMRHYTESIYETVLFFLSD
ncbi:MAG: FkbM family methyltransferase [Magnetococcus sp. YQC-9]